MPVPTLPYPTAEDCLVAARVITNDAAASIAGAILADMQPFTLPLVDLAHKTLRKMLQAKGINTYTGYAFVTGLGQSQTSDPGVQVQLSYVGYFDGVNQNPMPTLPANLLEPLIIWERQTASLGRWQEMTQAADSISTRAITSRFRIWDWESDILYFPPASQSNDLKIKYMLTTPKITDVHQQVPLNDCDMAMGALIAELASVPRGGEATAYFHTRAEAEVILLATPTAVKEQYGSHVRKPFRGRGRGRRR